MLNQRNWIVPGRFLLGCLHRARSYGCDNVSKCLQELSDISITPGSEEYNSKTRMYNPAFAQEHPAFVALPNSVDEVQKCLKSANFYKVPLAVRSGGHCFSGYSTIDSRGFVLSLNKLKAIKWSDNSVKVQGGASWRDVYNQMDNDVLVVGGCCPSVGIGGYVLGGGYGLLSRRFGLASDNALSMTMITADGENVVKASPEENSDLFWGLCGGGGGNFGVLFDVEFKTHTAPPSFTWSSFSFHNSQQSEQALKLIADCVHMIPDGLNIDMLIHKLPGYNQLVVDAVYSNNEMEQFPLLKQLRKIVDTKYLDIKHYDKYKVLSEEYALRHGYVHFEGKPVYMKGSFLDDFPPQLADILIELDLPSNPLGIIEFVHVGGQIATKTSSFSAYPHRQAQYNCYTYGQFRNKSDWGTVFNFATEVHSVLAAGGYTKGSYVNYIDLFLGNWQKEYYGDNYARLCDLKRKWNPVDNDGPLHFKQEIGSTYEPTILEPKYS